MKLPFAFLILLSACTTTPKLDPKSIRPWAHSLNKEYPREQSVIARYKKGDFELSYLAASHTSNMNSDTMRLVQKLFSDSNFKVVLIESIPHSSGESPKWFLAEAKKGQTPTFVAGGESALAAILADQKNIPFFAGEPDHQDIYHGLIKLGYTDLDVLGFYTARQIPQWIRQKEARLGLFERKIPPFLKHYCHLFQIKSCPSLNDILYWYKGKLGNDLSLDISNEVVAPYSDGDLFTQKISSEVGVIRDNFTLNVIQKLLVKYKKIAVIYGA